MVPKAILIKFKLSPIYLFGEVLGIQLRASCMAGKFSVTEVPSALCLDFCF